MNFKMVPINQNLCLVWMVLCLHMGILAQPDISSNVLRAGSQCFHVRGVPTLKLRCSSGELIRIHSVFYGTKLPPEGAQNDPDLETVCAYESEQNHCIQLTDMTENCMGRYMCSVYVSNPFLMTCRTFASYMQINYTCIPRFAIQDICEKHSVTSTNGYIRTPNYPDANYSSNLHCGCRLSTSDPSIEVYILDFSVNHTQMDNCDSDYLRVGTRGRKCGKIGPERLPEKLTSDSSNLNLEFHSDNVHTGRGVWLQYRGSKGGPVTRSCGPTIPRQRTHSDDVTILFNDRTDIHMERIHKDTDEGQNEYFLDQNPHFIEHQAGHGSNPLNMRPSFREDSESDPYPSDPGKFSYRHDSNMHPSNNENFDYIDSNYVEVDSDYDYLPNNLIKQNTYISHNKDEENAGLAVGDNRLKDPPKTVIEEDEESLYRLQDEPWKEGKGKQESEHQVTFKSDSKSGTKNLEKIPNQGTKPKSKSKGNAENNKQVNNLKHVNSESSIALGSMNSEPGVEPDVQKGGRITYEASYDSEEDDENMPRLYGIDTVQIITGVFVGVLILIAVIIIIVLVIRRT